MKNLSDIMSVKSWLVLLAGIYFSFFTIFHPSLWELAVFSVVDMAALVVGLIVDRKIFYRVNPVMNYLKDTTFAALSVLSSAQKKSVYADLAAFPHRRSFSVILESYLVNIPGTLILLFYWSYEGSIWVQLIKWCILLHISFFYMYVISLNELHQFASEKIQEIHKALDWSDVFAEIPPARTEGNLHLISSFGTLTIFMLLFLGQWFIITTDPDESWAHMAHFFCLGITCCILILRIRYVERALLLLGLKRVFSEFSCIVDNEKPTLALHTLPQIANFDRAYNELILRLRHKEEEIGLWMVKELDENRFKVMGEISGLVIHDLATPFQVVYFCVHEVLRKNPARLADKNFCDHLLKNIEHAKNLLFSYDGFLRNPKDPAHTGATIALAHQQAKDILNSQFFRHSLMQEIRFTLDPELADIPLAIGPADLLHVIYNLYKNSIEYLIQHPMEDPFIEVSLLAVNEKEIVFVVADSGVGISPAKFSDLVNAPLRLKNQAVFGKSVGLRLVYSLVQRHKGDLQVHNMGAGKTCMRVRLLTRAQEEESRAPHLIFEPEAVMG